MLTSAASLVCFSFCSFPENPKIFRPGRSPPNPPFPLPFLRMRIVRRRSLGSGSPWCSLLRLVCLLTILLCVAIAVPSVAHARAQTLAGETSPVLGNILLIGTPPTMNLWPLPRIPPRSYRRALSRAQRKRCKLRSQPCHLSRKTILSLLLRGGIEPNPGPSQLPPEISGAEVMRRLRKIPDGQPFDMTFSHTADKLESCVCKIVSRADTFCNLVQVYGAGTAVCPDPTWKYYGLSLCAVPLRDTQVRSGITIGLSFSVSYVVLLVLSYYVVHSFDWRKVSARKGQSSHQHKPSKGLQQLKYNKGVFKVDELMIIA